MKQIIAFMLLNMTGFAFLEWYHEGNTNTAIPLYAGILIICLSMFYLYDLREKDG